MITTRNITRYITVLIITTVFFTIGQALTGYCSNQHDFHQTTTQVTINTGWGFTGSLNTNRYGHTATLLENGKVLIVGGGGFPCSGNSCYSTVNGSVELYDPVAGTCSYTGDLNQRRSSHSATLLKDGRVLVAGGANWGYDIGQFSYQNSSELYDPATGKWRTTASFNAIQAYNSAVLLTNGKVLAVGPSNLNSGHVVYNAELYDPDTGTWSITAAPGIDGRLILLPDGKVLNVSGNTSELYDPATERWTSAGNFNLIRFVITVTLLKNGKILVTGSDESGLIPGAELYDPNTGAWSIAGSPIIAVGGTATLLSDGRVLVAGGYTSQNPVSGEDIYDPDTKEWSLTNHLNKPRAGHTATLLKDGRVLVTGGVDGDFDFGTVFHESAELYGPIAIPRITGASVSGKKLILSGEDFDAGAVILINSQEQITKNDDQSPNSALIGKKAGKRVKTGDKIKVRNRNGRLSEEFIFNR